MNIVERTGDVLSPSAFVYLDTVLDKNEPVYVRNVSKTRGVVVLTLNDGAKTAREAIPNTRYPICLSNKATPQMIRGSRDLRQLLDKRILELVSRAEAEKELADPEVRQALADAYERLGAGSSAVRKARNLDNHEDEVQAEILSDDPVMSDDFPDAEAETDYPNVQLRVQTLVESYNTKDMKSRQVKSELMTMDLTNDDLTYIISNTQGIVQKYAKEEFSKRGGRAADTDNDDDE